MHPSAFSIFRIIIGSWAGLVAACSVWLLVTEAISPGLSYFPSNAQHAAAYSESQGRASMAAAVGVVRGDLWSTAAIAEASRELFRARTQRATGAPPSDVEGAWMTARRAAARSPHDARVWLVLAGLRTRVGETGPLPAANYLKLSYYTGSNNFALSPLRLSIAAEIPWDDDLKSMLESEILRIIIARPDLKPAIAAAYQASTPGVRPMIEAILQNADPALLRSVKAQPQSR